jgi:beta-lactamase class A
MTTALTARERLGSDPEPFLLLLSLLLRSLPHMRTPRKAFGVVLSALLLPASGAFSQDTRIPDRYQVDTVLTSRLATIVSDVGLSGDFDVGEDGIEQISLAVIDLTGDRPLIGGVNMANFIYPASVYKMYVAAEVLEQVSAGAYSLWSPIIVRSPNVVDFTKEILSDPRPLLRERDTVTVNYLLDLMLTRSDNTAANCMIDLAGRKDINGFIARTGWQGSEVTRKFLKRKFEDPGYEAIRSTETCALHAADFMYLVSRDQLVNPWVSQHMKSFLARQLDTSKLAAGLPRSAMFYHKTGWWSYWTNDVGIVDDGAVRYIIACFVPVPEESSGPKLKELSRRVYEMMDSRSGR